MPRRVLAPLVPLCLLVSASAGCEARGRVAPPGAHAEGARPVAWERAPSPRAARWLKGQTHLHSDRSGDSRTPPERVVAWYAARGYDFIVFTDHDHVTSAPSRDGMLVFAGVELSQNPGRRCFPPPEPGLECLLHVNALFVTPPRDPREIPWGPARGAHRVDVLQRALDATFRLGGIAQLNHPNFHYAADAAVIAEMARRGIALLEIANTSDDSNDAGDPTHPSTERLWDQVLTAGALVYGVATDDAHHYDDADAVRAGGGVAHVGDRGFVMVRAERDERAIREAMRGGDFYSSTGVLLEQVAATSDALHVVVSRTGPLGGGDPPRIAFVGAGGRVLGEHEGYEASLDLTLARGGYARAVVTAPGGEKAWTQPVRVP